MTGRTDSSTAAAGALRRPATTPQIAARMSRQRTRDTEPEMRLRQALFAAGLRFRVDAPVPGMPRRRADVLLTRARIAVFVDGCFWHGCPIHATQPTTNAAWWRAKLARNIERDQETDGHLASIGWLVLRFWEHEDIAAAATVVANAWRQRASTSMPATSGEPNPSGPGHG